MSSIFGHVFRITTWGESHGGGVGVVIDGCPAGLEVDLEAIQTELDRRRPGQSRITSSRAETDRVRVLSGLFEGHTTGTPILLMVENQDARPHAYDHMKNVYRPSHADFTYDAKYGVRNWQGGGRASARETVGRVAAGALARQVLESLCPASIVAWVAAVADIEATVEDHQMGRETIDAHITRCPDPMAAKEIEARIDQARHDGDSLGGIVELSVKGVPAGLGEPVFDKLEARLAAAMLSLPAARGFEIGSGFAGTRTSGREHNDAFYHDGERVRTRTNRSGGIQGGISNGEEIRCRVAFKPTPTIRHAQETVDSTGRSVTLEARGRHDPCVLPRAVPIVEAMAALTLTDFFLLQRARHPDRV